MELPLIEKDGTELLGQEVKGFVLDIESGQHLIYF